MSAAGQPGSPISQVRAILVRSVNWLGDAVMTTPALQRLREAAPAARIALLSAEKIAPLWRHHPCVDEVLEFGPSEGAMDVARRLRGRGFELAVILPNSPRSALEAFLAGIPRRVGYARAWRNWSLTVAVPDRPGFVPMRRKTRREIGRLLAGLPAARAGSLAEAHHVHHYLHLIAALGGSAQPVPPHIGVTPEEVGRIRERFGFPDAPSQSKPLFGLSAGAKYGPAKRWPVERFAAAAVSLHEKTGCRWWVLGDGADRELGARIIDGIGAVSKPAAEATRNLAGETSLRESCAALQACEVVLTNDTGPMHLAAAVGVPVVALFGSTSPALTGPGLPGDPRHIVLRAEAPCAPCYRRECPIDFRCMKGISVEAVVAAVLQARDRNQRR